MNDAEVVAKAGDLAAIAAVKVKLVAATAGAGGPRPEIEPRGVLGIEAARDGRVALGHPPPEAGFGLFSVGAAYTVDSDADGDDSDLYYFGSLDLELISGFGLGLLVGRYDFDDRAAEDYTHYQASLTKGDFAFAVDVNDADDDDPRVWAAWGKSFDLL